MIGNDFLHLKKNEFFFSIFKAITNVQRFTFLITA